MDSPQSAMTPGTIQGLTLAAIDYTPGYSGGYSDSPGAGT